jgi:transaldolase/glucose-6-phosphate isomerase
MRPASLKTAESRGLLSCSLPPDLKSAVAREEKEWNLAGNTARLGRRDVSLWTNSDESQHLNWLNIVDEQLGDLSKFKALSAEVKEDGFTHLLVLGTGESSLAPEVFRQTFGNQSEAPELLVLDSTDPLQVASVRSAIDLPRTLFCVSSKSGATLETDILLKFFFDEATTALGDRAGDHFIAITDSGSELESQAAALAFRRVYQEIPGICGRFSAFSNLGLVPHAAAGYDTERFLKRAKLMVEASKNHDTGDNPAVLLGLILATAAKVGRDKVTIISSSSISGLGAWLEQLLAESTGKGGRGLIPIDREPLAEPESYGKDRIFAYLKHMNDGDRDMDEHVSALEGLGRPVIRMVLEDLNDIAQTMFQWEVAMAVAGAVLDVNPFNQPDVEAGKLAASFLIADYEKYGALPNEIPILDQQGIKLFADNTNARQIFRNGESLGGVIRNHLDRLQHGDYFALLAYLPMFPEHEEVLQQIRKQIIESKQVSSTVGFGPRFLHSTGQLHKGGPNSGVFLQITCDETDDILIPGHKYTFGVAKAAQARGDFQVLLERNRRALRVHLGPDVGRGLDQLRNLICAATEH